MMTTIKLLNRQLVGKPYHTLLKSLFVGIFIFLLISISKVELPVKPFFFYASIGLFTLGISRQATKSLIKDGKINGLLQLPFKKKYFLYSVLFSISLYVLGTKTLLLFFLFSSVMEFKPIVFFCGAIITIFCCISGIFFILPNKLPKVIVLCSLITCGVFAWFGKNDLVLLTLFISLSLAGILYFRINPYDFRQIPVFHQHQAFFTRGNFFNYLLRYFIFNKDYVINSVFIVMLAILLPFIMSTMEMGNLYLLGLGILSINTPLGILFSSNRTLLDKVKSLPNQNKKIVLPYFLFVLIWNCVSSMIYLYISKLLDQPFIAEYYFLALSLNLLNSVGVVLLEWYFPIKKWRVESDLWHHPRKYIMACLLIILLMLVMTNPAFITAVGVLALSSIGLLFMGKVKFVLYVRR